MVAKVALFKAPEIYNVVLTTTTRRRVEYKRGKYYGKFVPPLPSEEIKSRKRKRAMAVKNETEAEAEGNAYGSHHVAGETREREDAHYSVFLKLLARVLRPVGAEYNPKKFSAITFHLAEPRVTVTLFSDGGINCTGAKTWICGVIGIHAVIRFVSQALGCAIGVERFKDKRVCKVQNIVSSGAFGFRVQLHKMSKKYKPICEYEPSTFVGASLKPKGSEGIMIVFPTGTYVIAGSTSWASTLETIRRCKPIVEEFTSVPKPTVHKSV